MVITVSEIAQFLNIPEHQIVRVEFWKYIVFVHRRDVGGQFISYRKLRQLIAMNNEPSTMNNEP